MQLARGMVSSWMLEGKETFNVSMDNSLGVEVFQTSQHLAPFCAINTQQAHAERAVGPQYGRDSLVKAALPFILISPLLTLSVTESETFMPLTCHSAAALWYRCPVVTPQYRCPTVLTSPSQAPR